MSLPRTHSGIVSAVALIVAAYAAVVLLAGCGMTPRQHMYAGCAADLSSTAYALEIDGGYSEGGVAADGNDWATMIAANALLVGMGEGMAWVDPPNKDLYYWLIAAVKYGFAAYNLGLMASD